LLLQGEVVAGEMHSLPVFSPDGKSLAVGGAADLRVFDVSLGEDGRRIRLTVPWGGLPAAFLHGNCVAVSGAHGEVEVWGLITGEKKKIWPADGPLAGLAVTPDGKRLITAHGKPGDLAPYRVRVWDPVTGEKVASVEVSTISGITLGADGKHFAGATKDGVKVWDVTTGKEVFSYRFEANLLKDLIGYEGLQVSITFSPDVKQLAVAWTTAPDVKKLKVAKENGILTNLAMTPLGRKQLENWRRGKLSVWDLATGKELCRAREFSGLPCRIAFSPDGKRMAVGCTAFPVFRGLNGELMVNDEFVASEVTVWDTKVVLPEYAFPGYINRTAIGPAASDCRSFAFSPDGRRLAVVAPDGKIKVYDLERPGPKYLKPAEPPK
jgi:WD40 repeat protein